MNLKRWVSQVVLKFYDDFEVEQQVIGPVRRCLEIIHKRTIDDAKEHNVRPSLAKCARNTKDKLRCHTTVPTDFGEKCWNLVIKLILKTIQLDQFPRDLRMCHRVCLVESCF